MRPLAILLLAMAVLPPLVAQTPTADVNSPQAVVSAAYECISGAAGKPRDWQRLGSLFRPDAHFIRVKVAPDGSATPTVMDMAAFRSSFEHSRGNEPFFEREVSHQIQRFGHIAHVLSVYESRRDPNAPPFQRGVNSFQLVYDGSRWWIQNLFWQGENEKEQIPPSLLKNSAD